MFLFLDFESYYSRDFTLSELSIYEYVRDPQFKVHGFSYAVDDSPVEWYGGLALGAKLAGLVKGASAIVAHNCKFDAFILAAILGESARAFQGHYVCTKGMSKAILGKTVPGHSLAQLARHFNLPPKGEMKTIGLRDLTPEQLYELGEYSKHDTVLCRELFNRFKKDFPAGQYGAMDWTVRTFCNPRYKLDVPMLEQAVVEEKAKKKAAFEALGIGGDVFRSSDKFAALLTERGYTVPMKKSGKQKDPATGQPKLIPAFGKTDLDFRAMLEAGNEELRTLAQARLFSKSNIIETRAASYARVGRTGAWGFDVEFSGADQTHRLSGSNGAGGNPQNPTKGSVLRGGVGVSDGSALVIGDASQIEARFVAYLSGDPALRRVIEYEPDLYCDYGSRLYGRPITKANKAERDFSKIAVLGLGYGMGWRKFKDNVSLKLRVISEDEAKEAVQVYRKSYAEVPRLWARLDEWIGHLADGSSGTGFADIPCLKWGKNYIELPSGLRLKYWNLRRTFIEGRQNPQWVFDVYDHKKLAVRTLYGGKLLENICQALAGEFIKEVLENVRSVCVGQVHDELHLIVPDAEATIWAGRLAGCLNTAPRWMPQMRLASEVKIGKTWADCK